jgi:large subunit ribosomal protein L23
MNEERLYQIINHPVVSEKSTMVADKNGQIVFNVRTDANKGEIAEAVEKLFEVKVKSVQVVNVRGKVKRFGQTPGSRSDWKKAYVCLHEGQDLDFLGLTGA